MSVHYCCKVAANNAERETIAVQPIRSGLSPSMLTRRCLSLTGWLIPSAVLALLPKCPVCLAAYVALGTGVGLSLSAATYLRMLLVTLSVAALIYLTARQMRRSSSLIFGIKRAT